MISGKWNKIVGAMFETSARLIILQVKGWIKSGNDLKKAGRF
jgi:hypothetical protein